MNEYGLSETEYKIVLKQIERRKKFREEFLKLRTDPCLQAQESGHVFDPALQRFLAMKATQLDHFKPSPKTALSGILLVVVPMLSYGTLVWYDRKKFLEDCACGRIKYRDRLFKLK